MPSDIAQQSYEYAKESERDLVKTIG